MPELYEDKPAKKPAKKPKAKKADAEAQDDREEVGARVCAASCGRPVRHGSGPRAAGLRGEGYEQAAMGARFGVESPPNSARERRYDRVEASCEQFVQAFNLADTEDQSCWDENDSCKAMNFGWPLPNVWLGTSVEDQKRADERIPHLLRCPAAVRF
jgi:hypothetical protein